MNTSGTTNGSSGRRWFALPLAPPSSVQTPNGLENQTHQPNAPVSMIPTSAGPSILGAASSNSSNSYVDQWSDAKGPWLAFLAHRSHIPGGE